jgi:AcrR family transcriptional regulator
VVTHEQILAAATDILAEGGPDGWSITNVAERAGVSRATAHRHFPTRDDLEWEVTGRLVAEIGIDIDPADPEGGDLGQRVDAIVSHFCAQPAQARGWLIDLMRGTPESTGAKVMDRQVDLIRLLVGTEAGRPGIDAEVLAAILLGGTLLWSVVSQRDKRPPADAAARFSAEVKGLMEHGAVAPGTFSATPSLARRRQGARKGRPA